MRKTSLYRRSRSSGVLRGPQRSSACTGGRGHQGSSEVITGHHRSSVRLYRRSRFLRHSAMLTRCSKKRLPCRHETLASHQYAISTQSVRNQDAIMTQSVRNQNAIKAYLQLHLDHGALLLLGELLEIHLRSRGQLGRQRETIRGRSLEGASQ